VGDCASIVYSGLVRYCCQVVPSSHNVGQEVHARIITEQGQRKSSLGKLYITVVVRAFMTVP